MKTSQKLNLTTVLGTITLGLSACSAKVEPSVPANLIPITPPALQSNPTVTATGTSTSTSSQTGTTINNPLFGKKFSNMMFTVEFNHVSGAQIKIDRSCGLSGDFCQSLGQLDHDSISVMMNDASSVATEDFGGGKQALLTVTADDQFVTLSSKLVDSNGKVQSLNVHKMSYSQTPCGDDSQGAGLEDTFTSTSYSDGGSAETTSCSNLY